MVLLSAKGTGKDMRFFLFLPALADMRALYRSDRSSCPGAVHRHATGAIVGPADNNESALDFETSDDDKTIDDL
eukprot:COSAG06_NODE_37730_length_431_cov_4.584337_1_plen_73_part_10